MSIKSLEQYSSMIEDLRCAAKIEHHIIDVDRDRGTPRGAAPPTPLGVRVTYHGGSIELNVCRDIESGETKCIKVMVAQGRLDRRVS